MDWLVWVVCSSHYFPPVSPSVRCHERGRGGSAATRQSGTLRIGRVLGVSSRGGEAHFKRAAVAKTVSLRGTPL